MREEYFADNSMEIVGGEFRKELAAFTRNFRVFLTIDGTATYNRHIHRASFLNLPHGFSTPVVCSALIGE